MNFLADENVEKSIVNLLREKGHDVISVSEAKPGCIDEDVFELAKTENRILITNDTDFGEMVFRQKKVAVGIILMRFSSELTAKKLEVLRHLLKFHCEKLQGHFTVVNEHQIKIRPLTLLSL